jgi:hypothetical protein
VPGDDAVTGPGPANAPARRPAALARRPPGRPDAPPGCPAAWPPAGRPAPGPPPGPWPTARPLAHRPAPGSPPGPWLTARPPGSPPDRPGHRRPVSHQSRQPLPPTLHTFRSFSQRHINRYARYVLGGKCAKMRRACQPPTLDTAGARHGEATTPRHRAHPTQRHPSQLQQHHPRADETSWFPSAAVARLLPGPAPREVLRRGCSGGLRVSVLKVPPQVNKVMRR